MSRWLAAVVLLTSIPIFADDNSKAKSGPPKKETAAPERKYQAVGSIQGKLLKVDTQERTIKVEHRVINIKTGSGKTLKDDLSLSSDVKVRTMKLPDRFDSQNKLIPYTEAEKQKAKGDDRRLPGYMAELSAVHVGQLVEVHLSINKPPPGVNKDKFAALEAPFVTMIVIVIDTPKPPEKTKTKSSEREKKRP